MADKQFTQSIFNGDNDAFQELYAECRALFLSYFKKHYPAIGIEDLKDIYQDSIVEFWSQIIDGRITEENLNCMPSTYIISIGRNKMGESSRKSKRNNKLMESLKIQPDSYHVTNGTTTPVLNMNDVEERDKEKMRSQIEFLKERYEHLGYPCTLLLRYTWYEDMDDDKILKAFDGYFSSTDSVKSKRFKCRKKLSDMYSIWRKSQSN